MRPRPASAGRAERGAVMVLALWLIIVLMVMAYSLAYEMRIALKSTSYAQRRLKAEGLARIGLARAVADLRNDRLIAFTNPSGYNDTLEDIWAAEDDEHLGVKVGREEGEYSVIVRDEDRKLDLNLIRPQSAESLVYLLGALYKLDEKEARVMVQALMDYRDPDLRAMSPEGGTEAEFYTDWALRHGGRSLPADWVFRPKNDDLQNLDELLAIPGFTRTMLYGDPAEEAARDPFEREERRNRREDSTALADYVTIGTGGGVNINTAGETVLTALLVGAGVDKSAADGLAKKIVQFRKSRDRVKENKVAGLTNPMQLREGGLDETLINALQNAMPLAVVSRVFVITARGEAQGVRRTVQARVTVGIESYQVDARDERRRGIRDEAGLGMIKNKPDLRVDPAVRVVWMNTPTE